MKVTKIEQPEQEKDFFGNNKEPMDMGKKIIIIVAIILAIITVFVFLNKSFLPEQKAPEQKEMEENRVLTSSDIDRIEKKELKAELDKIKTEDTYEFNGLKAEDEKKIEESIKERNKNNEISEADFSKQVEAEREKMMNKKSENSVMSDAEYKEALKKEASEREKSISEEVKKDESEQKILDDTVNSIEAEMDKIREQEQRDQN